MLNRRTFCVAGIVAAIVPLVMTPSETPKQRWGTGTARLPIPAGELALVDVRMIDGEYVGDGYLAYVRSTFPIEAGKRIVFTACKNEWLVTMAAC